jgi:hypothetical protein
MGTVGYMSPEQAAGHPVDFRSDQFSFGSVVYEMATGKPAFRRGTAVHTLAAILDQEPEPIAGASPATPVPLQWIVERCLAKDPDARYASTRDLARDVAVTRDRLADRRWTLGARSRSGRACAPRSLGVPRPILRRRGGAVRQAPPDHVSGTGIQSARFARDGERSLSRPLPLLLDARRGPPLRLAADVLSISRSRRWILGDPLRPGARAGAAGGAPRVCRSSRATGRTPARSTPSAAGLGRVGNVLTGHDAARPAAILGGTGLSSEWGVARAKGSAVRRCRPRAVLVGGDMTVSDPR